MRWCDDMGLVHEALDERRVGDASQDDETGQNDHRAHCSDNQLPKYTNHTEEAHT